MAKSRNPKLQLAREPAGPATPAADRTVHALAGPLRATYDAIVCGTALVQSGLIPENLATMLDDPRFVSMVDSSIGDLDDDDASLDGDFDGHLDGELDG